MIPSSQLASHIFSEHKGDETEANPAFEGFYQHDIGRIMEVHAGKHYMNCEGLNVCSLSFIQSQYSCFLMQNQKLIANTLQFGGGEIFY